MTENHKARGFSTPVFVLIIVILVIMASAASYYILRNSGKLTNYGQTPDTPQTQTTKEKIPLPTVSDSDQTGDIKEELDSTTEGNPETDIGELNSSASSL